VLLYVLLYLYARLGGNGVTLLAERHKETKAAPLPRCERGAVCFVERQQSRSGETDLEIQYLVIGLGFLVGILVGLTGMGGGSLMTPLLILVLRISPVVAVGTDLVQMTVTKAFGAWQHHRQGSVDYRLAFKLAVGSVPGALAGVGFLTLLERQGVEVDAVVSQVLGVALVVVAVLLFAKLVLGRWHLFGSGDGSGSFSLWLFWSACFRSWPCGGWLAPMSSTLCS
jgi:uncharacterized membrane protein YfcA